jgi:hypothetical protein
MATRALYSDDDEKLFEATRPILLNGISEVATRPDFLDRSLSLTLEMIPDNQRREEEALYRDFEAMRARVLGALLDAVSTALRNRPTVQLPGLPRMADFAKWIVAAEPALGWPAGAFLDAYQGNRAAANDLALESSTVATVVLCLMSPLSQWSGTLTGLLDELGKYADDKTKKRRDWPATPKGLSSQLRRVAPNLRQAGILVKFGEHNREGTPVTLEKACKQPSQPSQPSQPLQDKELGCDGCVTVGDGWEGGVTVGDGCSEQPSHPNSLQDKGCDGGDGGDGRLQDLSNPADECPF